MRFLRHDRRKSTPTDELISEVKTPLALPGTELEALEVLEEKSEEKVAKNRNGVPKGAEPSRRSTRKTKWSKIGAWGKF